MLVALVYAVKEMRIAARQETINGAVKMGQLVEKLTGNVKAKRNVKMARQNAA